MGVQVNLEIKPTIKVYYEKDSINKDEFKFLLYGIEEEGIPYEVHSMNIDDVTTLSYNASKDSRLGVGLGINKEEIALHYERLDKLSPLFRIKLQSDSHLLRSLGANAARLVKRMSFKKI
ncbi:glycerol dehydratase reactivase beta/small subunit family protein [Tissierella sp. MSJ-40]|uniref:Glycerol dehydratase reactivase beta/small subunit family protein n=1 Tax=Tissierella simiarum TaxID=2841534 RepID=A0ABS6E3Q8_9FIRM|nr:glycerol dehydratase reactivase beta/small subunit family protein [Tissierella simiarum]MBU5437533.1 glycerol dehydratase reactivase beta/small subunit family protein [Tissierella simiarum]